MNVKLDTFIALPLCKQEQSNSCSINITPYIKTTGTHWRGCCREDKIPCSH